MSKKQVAGYILDKRIGKGSYATVWKGHLEKGDEVVAVKVISRQTVTETSQLRQEVEVLRRISHVNIVRFRDLKKSASHFYLVLEFCAGGDLSQFLKERGKVVEETSRSFLTQIAAGLCTLHRQHVLHRDLKPQNILLSSNSGDPVLKIADFGFARSLTPLDMAATVCGSPLYMAPEILRHEPYDARADLWSVGAILYELLLGCTPFTGSNPLQLLANIEKSERISFEGAHVSAEGRDFLLSMLKRIPKERLSSKEFECHPYVRLPDTNERSDALVQTKDGNPMMSSSEWCLPTECSAPSSGFGSPLVASPPLGPSPEASPRASLQKEELSTAVNEAISSQLLVAAANLQGATERASIEPASPLRRAEDEYVVLTEQGPPISETSKRDRSSTDEFCENCSRIAHALEEIAILRKDAYPSHALALFLRALELLEKALNLSLAEETAQRPLREAFQRILKAAEAAAHQVQHTSSQERAKIIPARPNAEIFEYAVQCCVDAAMILKGPVDDSCRTGSQQKMMLALLLLDFLGSEAEGEDLSIISDCTDPLSRMIGEIDGTSTQTGGASSCNREPNEASDHSAS